MDSDEAFAILNISDTSSEGEITARYRELAARFHPDRGGDSDQMQELNRARDVARAYAKAIRSLVPTDDGDAVVVRSVAEALRMNKIAQGPERFITTARRYSQDRLEALRRQAFLVGGIGAASLFFAKDVLPEIFARHGIVVLDKELLTGTLLLLAALGGVGFWWLSERLRRFEREVEEFSRSLLRGDAYAALFKSIYPDIHELTYRRIVTGLVTWKDLRRDLFSRSSKDSVAATTSIKPEYRYEFLTAQRILEVIDEEVFAALLLARGLENGCLKRRPSHRGEEFIERFVFLGLTGEA